MLQSEQIELLDQLRYSDRASDRNEALRELRVLEMDGKFEEDDLLQLLDEKDFVFQTYAIGAIGRLKIIKGITLLRKMYQKSNDPLILPTLLETFSNFESDAFVECVLKKLKTLTNIKAEKQTVNQSFLLEQIVVPSLKYLQNSGADKVEETIDQFLEDPDPTIRWHALMTYDKLNLTITEEKLKLLHEKDSYALVREQASVMRDKKKLQ